MRFLLRKSIVVLTAVNFAAMVMGVSFQLHLSGHEDHAEHDSDECSVCQHFLSAPGKFTQEPEAQLPGAGLPGLNAEFSLRFCLAAFRHSPFSPRGPPPA